MPCLYNHGGHETCTRFDPFIHCTNRWIKAKTIRYYDNIVTIPESEFMKNIYHSVIPPKKEYPAKHPLRNLQPFENKQQEASMETRTGVVTFMNNPLTLVGNELKKGDKAPDFTLLDNDLAPVSLKDFSEKVMIISAVPSLDTPVCDMETRRFNQEATNIGDDVHILTVSMDLPFAQKRWCGNAGVERVQTLSDHKEASFGTAYGVLIKELRLLARCVFVIDKKGTIAGIHMVKEMTNEPDYDAVLEMVREAL